MSAPFAAWIGKYRVVERIGAGGMGEVFLVEESGSGVRRAMKTLRTGSPASDEWLRFMNEGQVHCELHHPNIAAFHEMFLCDGRPCLLMEYVDGETLYARLHRRGPMAVEEALEVIAQLCDALTYLHERGVTHRDLKSANIKITSTGVVKLLDFGVAKRQRVRGMTTIGTVVGTPEYLSPEQISGMPADMRSDIWALGLLAYEMLTGRLPFRGPDEASLYSAIRDLMPPPPSALNPAVPPVVDALVLRCLEKRASRRFQSTAEVRRQIVGAAAPATLAMAERLRSLPPQAKLALAAVAGAVLLWLAKGIL